MRAATAALLLAAGAGAAGAEGPRTLMIALDAVPFSLVRDITDPERGEEVLLRSFSPPQPLISTFPSSTSVAMVGLLGPLGLPRSPGYEARFFDWERRKVRGGGPISFFRIDFPWRRFFDWTRKGVVRTAMAGIRPVRASVGRAEDAIEAFFRSDADPFLVYIETTDLAAHLVSPAALAKVFGAIDRALTRAGSRYPRRSFRVVLFSDHGIAGGEPLENVWRAVRTTLEEGGYEIGERLRRPTDLVLTPFGLVSSFEVYVYPERAPEVADLLAAVPGVALCTYREAASGWMVRGPRGRARIRRRGESWEYRPESGDPLDYGEVLERLAKRSGRPGATEFSDHQWLEATSGHHYPDALYRIAGGFDLVENPASLLCSLEPGYMYGMVKTQFLARVTNGRMRWTHGALFREASLGFLLTDDPDRESVGALRFDRALPPLFPDLAANPIRYLDSADPRGPEDAGGQHPPAAAGGGRTAAHPRTTDG